MESIAKFRNRAVEKYHQVRTRHQGRRSRRYEIDFCLERPLQIGLRLRGSPQRGDGSDTTMGSREPALMAAISP